MHLRRVQASRNMGFCAAVSARAFKMRFPDLTGNPKTMGNAAGFPLRPVQMTGAISPGFTSPSVTIPRPIFVTIFSLNPERFAASIYGRSSGDNSM